MEINSGSFWVSFRKTNALTGTDVFCVFSLKIMCPLPASFMAVINYAFLLLQDSLILKIMNFSSSITNPVVVNASQHVFTNYKPNSIKTTKSNFVNPSKSNVSFYWPQIYKVSQYNPIDNRIRKSMNNHWFPADTTCEQLNLITRETVITAGLQIKLPASLLCRCSAMMAVPLSKCKG